MSKILKILEERKYQLITGALMITVIGGVVIGVLIYNSRNRTNIAITTPAQTHQSSSDDLQSQQVNASATNGSSNSSVANSSTTNSATSNGNNTNTSAGQPSSLNNNNNSASGLNTTGISNDGGSTGNTGILNNTSNTNNSNTNGNSTKPSLSGTTTSNDNGGNKPSDQNNTSNSSNGNNTGNNNSNSSNTNNNQGNNNSNSQNTNNSKPTGDTDQVKSLPFVGATYPIVDLGFSKYNKINVTGDFVNLLNKSALYLTGNPTKRFEEVKKAWMGKIVAGKYKVVNVDEMDTTVFISDYKNPEDVFECTSISDNVLTKSLYYNVYNAQKVDDFSYNICRFIVEFKLV